MAKLQEIHAAQAVLIFQKSSLTDTQRQIKQNQMRQAYSMISREISKNRDFPFPNRMLDMGTLLAEIRSGAVKTDIYPIGKSDAQLLAEIQERQTACFRKMLDKKK